MDPRGRGREIRPCGEMGPLGAMVPWGLNRSLWGPWDGELTDMSGFTLHTTNGIFAILIIHQEKQ